MGVQAARASVFGAFPFFPISTEENSMGDGALPEEHTQPSPPAGTQQSKYFKLLLSPSYCSFSSVKDVGCSGQDASSFAFSCRKAGGTVFKA